VEVGGGWGVKVAVSVGKVGFGVDDRAGLILVNSCVGTWVGDCSIGKKLFVIPEVEVGFSIGAVVSRGYRSSEVQALMLSKGRTRAAVLNNLE
jgi:hypothetical protein